MYCCRARAVSLEIRKPVGLTETAAAAHPREASVSLRPIGRAVIYGVKFNIRINYTRTSLCDIRAPKGG